MAGLESLGIEPLRRTALTIDPPAGVEIRDWPEMMDADEEFYFKPDAGQLMISPADETPSKPCDAQAEDIRCGDWAFTGLNRLPALTSGTSTTAGRALRTFAPDRVFVTGFDPRTEGFFWLAGQGGYGVQSSPAMARLTRFLVNGVVHWKGIF